MATHTLLQGTEIENTHSHRLLTPPQVDQSLPTASCSEGLHQHNLQEPILELAQSLYLNALACLEKGKWRKEGHRIYKSPPPGRLHQAHVPETMILYWAPTVPCEPHLTPTVYQSP